MKQKRWKKEGRSLRSKLCGWLVLSCVCAFFCTAALTESEVTPVPTLEPGLLYPNEAESIDIHSAQERLAELGYLEEDETTYVVDWEMRYALKRFCEKNGILFEDKGITQEIWNRLMYSTDLEDVLEEVQDPYIPFGEQSDRVTKIQIRLKDLGYFNENVMTLAVYDTSMHHAVEEFCRVNKLTCEATGLSQAMQDMINSDAALPYVREITTMEWLRLFLVGNTIVNNVRVPNLLWLGALYLLIYLLVIGLVMLIFRVYRRRFRNSSIEPVAEDFPTFDRPKSGENCYVDFQIIYQSSVTQKRCNIRGEFSVGRAGCSLCLDKNDRSISKKHCQLHFLNSVLQLKDTSKNGTYVNETLVQKRTVELRSGDRIQIGEHMLIVRY